MTEEELDDLPFIYPETEPSVPGVGSSRKAKEPPTEEARRRGKRNRSRGLAIQRDVARHLGLTNVQGNGPADARDEEVYGNAMFVCQVKSGLRFPGWMDLELQKLPRTGGRIPILAIANTPGPGGGRRRVLVVMDAADWNSLHRGEREEQE